MKRTGDWGEEIALKFYLSLHYKLRAKNWRAGRYELDLILEKDKLLIFVEVKTRSSKKVYSARESLRPKQIKHLLEASEKYLEENSSPEILVESRFDLVAISGNPKDYKLEHIEDAFFGFLDLD